MRGALERIAKQKTTDEIYDDDKADADFEGAYDTIIKIAREAVGVNG